MSQPQPSFTVLVCHSPFLGGAGVGTLSSEVSTLINEQTGAEKMKHIVHGPHCQAGIQTGVQPWTAPVRPPAVGCLLLFSCLVPPSLWLLPQWHSLCALGALGAVVWLLSMWGKGQASLGCPGVGVLRTGQERKETDVNIIWWPLPPGLTC